jgi:fucose 4-O-acetylase-like acetyltransferase
MIIYAFHMPLFMLVSGYFFPKSVQKLPAKAYFVKILRHLYIPSVIWGMIGCSIICANKLLVGKAIELPYVAHLVFTGAWFLTTLFLLQTIGVIVEQCSNKTVRRCIYGLIYVTLYLCPIDLWMLHELKFLMPFFFIGSWASRWNWERMPWWLGLVALVIFVSLFPRFQFGDTVYMMTDEVASSRYHYQALLRFVMGLTGSMCAVYLCQWIKYLPALARVLGYLGRNTLPIYVLHQYFLNVNRALHIQTTQLLLPLIVAMAIVALSILLYQLLRRNNCLKQLLFGEIASKQVS